MKTPRPKKPMPKQQEHQKRKQRPKKLHKCKAERTDANNRKPAAERRSKRRQKAQRNRNSTDRNEPAQIKTTMQKKRRLGKIKRANQDYMPRRQKRKDNEHKYGQKRKPTKWEDVALIEYNPLTKRWECRFEHFRRSAPCGEVTIPAPR